MQDISVGRNPSSAISPYPGITSFSSKHTIPREGVRSLPKPLQQEKLNAAIDHYFFFSLQLYSFFVKKSRKCCQRQYPHRSNTGSSHLLPETGQDCLSANDRSACIEESHASSKGFMIICKNDLDGNDALFYEMTSRSFFVYMFFKKITCRTNILREAENSLPGAKGRRPGSGGTCWRLP